MTDPNKTRISKFLSLILRHQPETIGLALDEAGWADVAALLQKLAAQGTLLSIAELEEVVATNSKQRFAFNEDHTRIRASQGHSIDVELRLTPLTPPEYLYHGTVAKFMAAIKAEGLKKMSRQHVHLSSDKETAVQVGSRRGAPVILSIKSGVMHGDGAAFYQSQNGVWLTDAVAAKYIEFE